MKPPVWLERTDCLAIHEMVLAQHGGLAGVRDDGLLESALGKPQNLFAYGKPTRPQMAASYAAGIIRNHPFLDGNKRTGAACAIIFLAINGVDPKGDEEGLVELALAVAQGQAGKQQIADFFRKITT